MCGDVGHCCECVGVRCVRVRGVVVCRSGRDGCEGCEFVVVVRVCVMGVDVLYVCDGAVWAEMCGMGVVVSVGCVCVIGV